MTSKLRAAAVVIALTLSISCSLIGASAEAEPAPSPFGIACGYLYNHLGNQAHSFLPFLHDHGAGLSHVILFGQQIEPEKGQFEWSAPTADVNELNSPDEGIPPGVMEPCP